MIQPTGLKVLEKMGLSESIKKDGKPIKRLISENHKGRVIFDIDFTYQGLNGYGVHRGSIFSKLLDKAKALQVSIRTGVTVDRVSESTLFSLDDQNLGTFDLIVVADGRGSLIRKQFGHLVKVARPQPYAALWTKLPQGDSFKNQINHVYDGTDLMLGLMSIGSDGAGGEDQLNFFCGVHDGFLETWGPDSFEEWKAKMKDLAPAYIPYLNQIKSHDQLVLARYFDVQLKKQFEGNVAIIGDAAHALSPHLSSGTNLAMLDAWELSEALKTHESLPSALIRFNEKRRRQIKTYYGVSKLITPFFQSKINLSYGRDTVLRLLIKIPYFRTQILKTVLGIKKGFFSTLKKEYYHG